MTYVRADGRNVPGVDVPYPFDGVANFTVPLTGAEVERGFLLVRHQAKAESPSEGNHLESTSMILSVIAQVDFYGEDGAGRAVMVTGYVNITFARLLERRVTEERSMSPMSCRVFSRRRNVEDVPAGFARRFALFAAGCLLDNPDTPELEGPSTLGRSIEVRAIPDSSYPTACPAPSSRRCCRGPNGERISGVTIFFDHPEEFVDLGNLAPLNGARPTYGGVEAGPGNRDHRRRRRRPSTILGAVSR